VGPPSFVVTPPSASCQVASSYWEVTTKQGNYMKSLTLIDVRGFM